MTILEKSNSTTTGHHLVVSILYLCQCPVALVEKHHRTLTGAFFADLL